MRRNMKYDISWLQDIPLDFSKNRIIFLKWDLWSWKTTLVKHILEHKFWINENVTSPTYTYYNKYWENIYHFDLYRLEKYEEFFAIWWEEILDSWALCFIEWPDILEEYFQADMEIRLEKCDELHLRDIIVINAVSE